VSEPTRAFLTGCPRCPPTQWLGTRLFTLVRTTTRTIRNEHRIGPALLRNCIGLMRPWPERLSERVHRRYTGCTTEVHRRIRCASGVPPVYLRCTQREGLENRAVRSEMNPNSADLPKAYVNRRSRIGCGVRVERIRGCWVGREASLRRPLRPQHRHLHQAFLTITAERTTLCSNSHLGAPDPFGVHPLGCPQSTNTLKGGHQTSHGRHSENGCTWCSPP